MQNDPLVKVSSTSERFAKLRAQREGTATAVAASAPTPAPPPNDTGSSAAATAATLPTSAVADDPLAHFQAQHHAELQKRQSEVVAAAGEEDGASVAAAAAAAAVAAAGGANSELSTPVKKKVPPKVPERLEVTASALAAEFLKKCEKEIGDRADQRACESIEGVMEVAQRGAWAHVLSGAPMHLVALRSQEHFKRRDPDGPLDDLEHLAARRTLTVLQLVAYVQLGQYMLAADAIREELRCSYILDLEKAEAEGKEGRTARNIARLTTAHPAGATGANGSGGGGGDSAEKIRANSDDDYKDAADNNDQKARHNYNVPVAALMIHAELPFGLHQDADCVIARVQMLMQEIDDHAARLEGAEHGTVGYSDDELRHIAHSTGAVPGFSSTMPIERLRDAYCAIVAGARSPGAKMPSLLPDHFSPVALMDRVQCCAWRIRLLEVLVGHCVPARRTALAIKMCKEVYVRTSRYLEYARAAHPLSIFSVALTRIARILTCAGAMDIAAPLLQYVNESTPSEGPEANALQLELAMLRFARRDYHGAMVLYKKVLDECIHNRHDATHAASFVVDPPGFSGRMIAANNFAICCVHNCCVADGIRELEALLQSDPMRFFRKELLFNLCTLYDLALSKRLSFLKKTALKIVGDKYFLSHLQHKHYLLQ